MLTNLIAALLAARGDSLVEQPMPGKMEAAGQRMSREVAKCDIGMSAFALAPCRWIAAGVDSRFHQPSWSHFWSQ